MCVFGGGSRTGGGVCVLRGRLVCVCVGGGGEGEGVCGGVLCSSGHGGRNGG